MQDKRETIPQTSIVVEMLGIPVSYDIMSCGTLYIYIRNAPDIQYPIHFIVISEVLHCNSMILHFWILQQLPHLILLSKVARQHLKSYFLFNFDIYFKFSKDENNFVFCKCIFANNSQLPKIRGRQSTMHA